MKEQFEPISLFDEPAQQKQGEVASALSESATTEWKNFYAAVSEYAQRLNPFGEDRDK